MMESVINHGVKLIYKASLGKTVNFYLLIYFFSLTSSTPLMKAIMTFFFTWNKIPKLLFSIVTDSTNTPSALGPSAPPTRSQSPEPITPSSSTQYKNPVHTHSFSGLISLYTRVTYLTIHLPLSSSSRRFFPWTCYLYRARLQLQSRKTCQLSVSDCHLNALTHLSEDLPDHHQPFNKELLR